MSAFVVRIAAGWSRRRLGGQTAFWSTSFVENASRPIPLRFLRNQRQKNSLPGVAEGEVGCKPVKSVADLKGKPVSGFQ